MNTEGKFGPQEATWLAALTISAKVFFTSPAMITDLIGTTGWYMTLISLCTASVSFGLIVGLLKRFPGRDLDEIYELSLGRAVGSAFSLILGIYLLFLAALDIGEFQQVLKIYVFPNTPNWYIVLIFTASVACMAYLGLESMARVAKILAYFVVSGFLAVIVLSAESFEVANLFPILGYGLDRTLINGVLRSSAYGEVIILAIFAKALQGTTYVKKAGFASLLLSGAFIALSLLAFTLCFPYYVSREITSPMYELATLIDYGRFVQRIEPIFLFIWISTALLSVTALFYSFIRLYCGVFRIADKKPLVIACSVILFSASLMQRDISGIVFQSVQLTRNISFVPFFLMPSAALLVARIRKKGGNELA